jgi:hypothetical protein
MLLRDIYQSALRFLAESTNASDNADYEERAPYILATLCCELQSADSTLRKFLGKATASISDSVYLPLDSEFPLLPRFSGIAALYLAAMLILDDNSSLSDSLYDKYCDAVSSIYASIESVSESVKDVYFGNK